MNYIAIIDGIGALGNYMHFGLVSCLVGSAFLIFMYLWKKGKLDMEEDAKYEMMRSDVPQHENEDTQKKNVQKEHAQDE